MLTALQRDKCVSHFVADSLANTLAEAWRKCEDGTEMVRLCMEMLGMEGWPTTREILQVVCECAETTFRYLPKNEKKRLQACVRLSRLWAEGKATFEDSRVLRDISAGTAGPIARLRNAARKFAGKHAVPPARSTAGEIAYATLAAACVDRCVPSRDAAECKFGCIAIGVLSSAASDVAHAARAYGSAPYHKAYSEWQKTRRWCGRDYTRTESRHTSESLRFPDREAAILSELKDLAQPKRTKAGQE